MPFRIDPRAPIDDEIRRIAHEQTADALDQLDSLERIGVESAVHRSRKVCKKVRGLVRLVRPALAGGQYEAANASYRDAARALSAHRDAHASLATFDAVVATSADRLPDVGLLPVREALVARARDSDEAASQRTVLVERATDLLREAQSQIDEWCLDDDGWDAIAGGLRNTYERGVAALEAVVVHPHRATTTS